MKKLIRSHFDQQPFTMKCVWLVLATLVFLVSFYATTAAMSIIYALDEAPLAF